MTRLLAAALLLSAAAAQADPSLQLFEDGCIRGGRDISDSRARQRVSVDARRSALVAAVASEEQAVAGMSAELADIAQAITNGEPTVFDRAYRWSRDSDALSASIDARLVELRGLGSLGAPGSRYAARLAASAARLAAASAALERDSGPVSGGFVVLGREGLAAYMDQAANRVKASAAALSAAAGNR